MTPAVTPTASFVGNLFWVNPDTPIGTREDFLALDIPYKVESKGSTLQLSGGDLPRQTEIWTMEYQLL